MFYEVSHDRVASETMDGEVVILDQIAGTYFSLGGVGMDIWSMLLRGATIEGIVASMEARFEAPAVGTTREAVQALVAELVKDALLVEMQGEVPGEPPASVAAQAGAERQPWAAPTLERFTDLQSLLLLDPIHDVDDSGWPRQPT